ncbi:MAG: hypothetical protein OQK48_03265 [Sulfurimonas sp.]|uniref:tetratricopeptide repeat protein n=1 Tax=Sulfurimonas sp. TaxID=2022749 RepID=UPI00261B69F2|nr:hypothetical protein [Sulfurimonas sp.]MCW8894840.1 hypothetical protein [Sulfurimonas sp.]MCW8953940.1 hypothetical protein [Sulfurimonas sp.]MCW9067699.1 hypothetical protein [Sulfurimonas sp.]
MYDIIKIFISIALLITITGCTASTKSVEVKGHEKVFDNEDIYILTALRAEQLKEYDASSSIFNTLYNKTDKKEYLYRSLQNDLADDQSQRVIDRVDEILNNTLDDFVLVRFKIIALIKQDKLLKAKELAISLVESSKEMDDYLLVSEIHVKLKEFNTAVKYLESAYIKEYNEEILDKMSIVLYVNLQRKKDAIAQLETHSRVYGCSKQICSRLIGFYSDENNIDGLLSTYLRLYKIDSNKKIANKIIQIYGYKKDYLSMIEFLEKNETDDDLLLQLYIQTKNYKKAAPLAHKLYKSNGDPSYLGQSAIFEYEGADDKNDKNMHDSIIKKLEEVIEAQKEGIYLNYLGYILIDHDIDAKKGLEYIHEALKIEPNSIYYLDSLAWGYYKLGECQKAKKIMDRVKNMDGSSNPEVVKHIEMINKCIKIKKGKK